MWKSRTLNLMAKTFQCSHFTVYDFSTESIENAKNESRKLGISNTYFKKQDVSRFDHNEQFDFITAFDAIHDQAEPEKVLENIHKSLKSNGTFLMQDIAG